MKATHFSLAATTALTMSMSVALADDNNAYLDQSGANNSASITQSGNSNDAGSATNQVTQSGAGYNTLVILQSGDGNDVGLESNDDSLLSGITQTRGGSDTRESNEMTITQTSGGNTVGSAVQVSSGQSDNDLTITQGGSGGHVVGSVYQRQSSSVDNIATITQNGSNNTLARVVQDARSGGGYNPNEITVAMAGSDNGGGSLTGAAAASGAMSSTLIQGYDLGTKGNKMILDIAGAENQFGVSQVGLGSNQRAALNNTIGTLKITGDSNEVGIFQQGDHNGLTIATISGSENILGLRQVGSYNTASLNISGDQNGGYNGFGANAAGALGLTAGLIDQNGTLNDVDLTVSGTGNVFAMLQDNSLGGTIGNQITGTQDNSNGGAGNEAAVKQDGDNNGATFTQIGAGNVAAISQ